MIDLITDESAIDNILQDVALTQSEFIIHGRL